MKISAALTLIALAGSCAVVANPIHYQLPVGALDLDGLRLIQYSNDAPAKWMTEQQIEELLRLGIKYMDITDYEELGSNIGASESLGKWKPYIPSTPAFQDEVEPFIGNLTTDLMELNLKAFTSFKTRYYKSSTGVDSAKWLHKQVADTIASADLGEVDVSVRKFVHKWDQFSIIARFEGTNPDLNNELVIVGAHQDSVNMWLPSFGRAPGADDDGSGTVTILEAFRVLVQGGFRPERAVEFHWYSGEEAGLLGSQAVALDYQQAGKRVVAMIQNDMTGYIGSNGEVVGVVLDFVDPKLTEFVKKLVETYADIPWKDTKCGYGCSDHASWNKAGYPSAFTIESAFEDSNHYIHTSDDTIDHLSFDHMIEFSKLSVAFAIELSHLRS
ncbi:hypothetical protein BC937DRAFT_91044 [Endogone sp. FLAS-F59071]|nr:hypothetical protein BC937DRAFT_91044 [Endogone sp. FLAS-F59071]|eukprot:RUS21925.1 hypothetical protein BC937DRAFT_91044 [Endogone sp. FLAS-F59071]